MLKIEIRRDALFVHLLSDRFSIDADFVEETTTRDYSSIPAVMALIVLVQGEAIHLAVLVYQSYGFWAVKTTPPRLPPVKSLEEEDENNSKEQTR